MCNSSDPFGLEACTKEEVAAGKETVPTKGQPACVEQRNRKAQACFASEVHFTTIAAMDATSVLGITGVARASVALAGRTLEHFIAMMLNAGEKAAGEAAMGAADHLVNAGTALAVGTARGAVVSVGNGAAEAGGISLRSVAQSFIPFKGTGDRLDRTVAACTSGSR